MARWAGRKNRGTSLPTGSAASAVDRYFELSVLGLITSGYLAVLGSGYLDAPTAALAALGLLLRVLMISGALRFDLSGRVTLGLTIAYILFYPADYFLISQDFVAATVHLVFFLAVMKVLTARVTRDYIFLGIIGFLELLAASILSANLTFFAFLTLFLVFGVATFASAEVRRSMHKPHHLARTGLRRFPWRLAALTLTMSAGILILTAGLFFLLPRTAQAAFRHFVPTRYHLPGFSNEMTLGDIGEIQKRQTAVMHVRFGDGEQPRGLKWRGMALASFDGRRWFNPPEPGTALRVSNGLIELADLPQRRREGVRLRYEVQLNAMASDALFLAGTTEFLRINSARILRTSTDSYRAGYPNFEGLHYGAYSFLDREGVQGLSQERGIGMRYLELPRLDPRIAALARRVSEGTISDAERARAIEQYLQTHYSYTLKLLDREVPDPLAYFLFDRRQGHCEYFASAMAVMLRSIGIPSRVATGFQSGVLNPLSGWYVVRASDAHSWVEAYLPGVGWKTYDPTPAGQDVAVATLWARMGFYVDAAETFWEEWVLSYNLDRQLILATEMESSSRSFGSRWMDRVRATGERWRAGVTENARRFGAPVAALIALAILAWWAWPAAAASVRSLARVRKVRRGEACASDATLLYSRMLRFLRRRGFEKPAWITPAEFVRMLPASETSALVNEFTQEYNELRFGGDAGAATRMIALLERIEQTAG